MSNIQSQCSAGDVGVARPDPRQRAAFTTAGLWRQLQRWSARARQRRDLAKLNDDLLADIGLRREDALYESQKPFWRA